MLVDSHCHLDKLDLTAYQGDLDQALAAARTRGVEHVVCIGIDLENIAHVVSLTEQYHQVFATVGVHPLYRDSREPALDELLQWSNHPKIIGIG
ncbi:MAG: TatD family hydrolase, partial [Ketobacter sp.]